MRRQVSGILLLDKPTAISSNGALQRVKRLFSAKKAGHTGSLDPLATGMLPLCFGEATKFSQFLLDSDKTYQVTAKLGVQTTTGDSEGEVVLTSTTAGLTTTAIEQVMTRYVGAIDQVPPMFSALKFQGKPLYELARKGIEIERKSRRITIFSLQFESYVNDELTFTVHCSKGTYVRTLVEDIGRDLGCGGHVIALRRLRVSPYHAAHMHTLPELEAIAEAAGHEGLLTCLLPVETAVQSFPAVKLSTAATFYLRMGQPVRSTLDMVSPLVRLLSEDARFLGIGEVLADGRVKPHRLVATA
jgi:tRNA pseudouridine55 synthase